MMNLMNRLVVIGILATALHGANGHGYMTGPRSVGSCCCCLLFVVDDASMWRILPENEVIILRTMALQFHSSESNCPTRTIDQLFVV
jgi:hypothetical protein